MRKTKLLAVAAGFLAAAGIATAGKIFIDGVDQGEYQDVQISGNGAIKITTSTSSGTTCTNDQDQFQEGCQEAPYDACPSGTDQDLYQPGCQEDTSGGGTTNPDPDPEPVGDCATPSGFSRDTGTITSFSTFPGEKGTKVKYSVRTGRYMAAQFTAPAAGRAGSMFFISDMHATPGLFTSTISKCPGDFRPYNGDSSCRVSGSSLNFYWASRSDGDSNKYTCDIKPGETFYLNIAYALGTGNDLSNSCTENSCGHLMQWDNY